MNQRWVKPSNFSTTRWHACFLQFIKHHWSFLRQRKIQDPTYQQPKCCVQIRCKCGICYISQTARSLEHWIYEYRKCSENQIRSTKDEHTLEKKSAIVLHAIKFGHTVAFENAQPVITNVRNLYDRIVAVQLTIKATEKKNCNRKDASPLSKTWIPLIRCSIFISFLVKKTLVRY